MPNFPQTDGLQKGNPNVNVKPNAILQPKTRTGELLHFTLQSSPENFPGLVRDRIQMISDERSRQREAIKEVSFPSRKLYRRIFEVQRQEQRAAVEDILYTTVLHRFSLLGVSPIEPHQLQKKAVFMPAKADLMCCCAPSDEEKELVNAHMKYILGPWGVMPFVTMCKYQAFEVFGLSVLFGYFLRHTASRFALARSAGLNPWIMSDDETRAMLNDLFHRSAPSASEAGTGPLREWGHAQTLKEYMDGLDLREVVAGAFISQEAANVIHSYLSTLFGDVGALLSQWKEALKVPLPVQSIEFQQRLLAMDDGRIDIVGINWSDLRRLVLEAVALGTFLKSAEASVELSAEEQLLTPANFLTFP